MLRTIPAVEPFAYWDGPDRSILREFLLEWRDAFPSTRMLGDSDIVPELTAFSPEDVALFRRIRIPAAKSDIARLVALYARGGLYVDCHCGIRDVDELKSLFGLLETYELVLWQRSFRKAPRPSTENKPVNGVILARPRSTIVAVILREALHNLRAHADREAREGRVDYSIWHMLGAGHYRQVLHEPDSNNTRLRPEFEGRITFSDEDHGPIEFWRHSAYRRDRDSHWSKRQGRELLLDPAGPPPH